MMCWNALAMALTLSLGLERLSLIFDWLAQNLSVAIRSTGRISFSDSSVDKALGMAWETTTIVKVRWGWLSLSAVLLVASLSFFGITVTGTV